MKRFAIINGKDLLIRNFKNMEDAIEFCQNFLDQSQEIVVREIKTLDCNFRTKL
tara:strand:- start:126 stop:287 length:162 start_codon:yes stop_codon:yes gene_type:complete